MTEFAAYFDDSGHPDDQNVVIVAGFISTEEQWLLFEKEWGVTLSKAELDMLHMTEFERSRKWSPLKKQQLRREFIATIKRRTRFHISQTIPMEDYRQINDAYMLQEFQGAPYAVAGRAVAKCMNDWRRENMSDGDRIAVFFEEGTKHKGDFIDVLTRDELPCPTFLKKKDAVPLQAADLLAWEVFHAMQTNQVRKSLGSLARHAGEDGIFRYSDLEEMCKEIPAPRRGELHPQARVVYHNLRKKVRRRTIW